MRLTSFLALAALGTAAPSIARAKEAPSPDAVATYEEQAVGVRQLVVPLRDGTTGDADGHVIHDGKWDVFAGRDHHPLDDEAFFRIVGRDDLARRYWREALVKNVLTASGAAALAGGLIFAWLDYMYRNQPNQNLYLGNPPPPPGVSPTWGLAVAGVGLTAMIVSHSLDPTPIDAGEADRLARDYNQSLRSRLGIADTASRQ